MAFFALCHLIWVVLVQEGRCLLVQRMSLWPSKQADVIAIGKDDPEILPRLNGVVTRSRGASMAKIQPVTDIDNVLK